MEAKMVFINDPWINVEDSLPPDLHEVMFFATINKGMSREIMNGHRKNDDWYHCCLFYSSMRLSSEVIVTHWMELPDYPKDEK